MKTEKIGLEPVTSSDTQVELLYQQLSSRTSSISHFELPNYETHREFVAKHPYRAWFIIKLEDLVLGNVYVQYDNSIGLNCNDQITEAQIETILYLISYKLKPLNPIPSVRCNKFFLNVASSNINLQTKLKNIGLKESQRSFVLETIK